MSFDNIIPDCIIHISEFLNPFYGLIFYSKNPLNLVKKIRKEDVLIPEKIININFLEFLKNSNMKLSVQNKKHIIKHFIKIENYNGLEWCLQNNFPNISYLSAESGSLDILKWCHSQNIIFDFYTSFLAAKNDHLHILQWMVRNLNDYNAASCIRTYNEGIFPLLEWGNKGRIDILE